MLKKIILTNFQAHKHLEVECDKFTTLTGGSNGGKSSVLRAILGLVRNDSVGDYVRHGQKSLSVKLEFDEGVAVEWFKGSGVNKYVVTDKDGNDQTYDKVGSDVPDEVREVLLLGPIAIKGSDKEFINFHPQLDAPFMISSTPGNVAKLFGELTSASQLYTGVAEGNRRVRSTNSIRKTRKEDLDTAKDDLKHDFANLEDQHKLYEAGSKALSEASEAQEGVDSIEATVAKLSDLEASTDTLQDLISEHSFIDDLDLRDLDDIARQCTRFEAITTELEKYDTFDAKVTKGMKYLESAVETNLTELEALSLDIGAIEKLTKDTSDLAADHDNFESAITEALQNVTGLTKKIDEKMEELDTCPECEQDLTENAKEALLDGRAHAAH